MNMDVHQRFRTEAHQVYYSLFLINLEIDFVNYKFN